MDTQQQNWMKDISLFLVSQTITLFGSSLVQYAMLWHITLTTDSGLMLTLYIICGFLPTFFLAPVAGVWADRYNRKNLIILSDGLIALATLILAILFFLGFESIWLLFLMAGIRALGTGIQMPAVGAILPQIVPEQKLTRVNGINSSLQAAIIFLSPMASAALLTWTTIERIFLVDVFTAAVAIGILFILKIPVHQKAAQIEKDSYFHDFKKGITYVQEHRFLKNLFFFMASFFILVSPSAFLTPLQISRNYGEALWRLSAIEIAFSVGMMAGGGLMILWGGFRNKIHTLTFCGVLIGSCTIGFGTIPNFTLYLLLMGLFGMTLPLFNIPATVMLQEKVTDAYLGRIFGVMSMIRSSMMPMGMLVFGPLADQVPIEWILRVTGFIIIGMAILLSRNDILLQAGVSSKSGAQRE